MEKNLNFIEFGNFFINYGDQETKTNFAVKLIDENLPEFGHMN